MVFLPFVDSRRIMLQSGGPSAKPVRRSLAFSYLPFPLPLEPLPEPLPPLVLEVPFPEPEPPPEVPLSEPPPPLPPLPPPEPDVLLLDTLVGVGLNAVGSVVDAM
jgi:hypothetical protein